MIGQSLIRNYKPSPTLNKFHLDNSFVRGVMGPLGSGKSVGCAIEILKRACQQEPDSDGIRRTRCAVTRNTDRQLRDTTFKTLIDWMPLGQAGHFVDKTFTYFIGCDKNYRPGLIQLPDGTAVVCEILFRALDRPDQVRNLLSMELTFAWMNEFREMPFDVFRALTGRVGRFPSKNCTWAGIWMDSNPPGVESRWYSYFEEYNEDYALKLEEEFNMKMDRPILFKQPSGLAPDAENIMNLKDGRGYYLKMLADGRDEAWTNVHVHGKYGFVADGRSVYGDIFNHRHHVAAAPLKPIPGRALGIGIDFGLTPAAVISQFSPEGRWYILSEIVATDMGAVQFTKQLRRHIEEKYHGFTYFLYGDPAGNVRSQNDMKSAFDIFAAAGFPVTTSEKSVQTRIDSVREGLRRFPDGDSGFIIDPSCGMLIRGFQGGYRYRRVRVAEERYTEEPDKNQYSHVHDALQYIMAPFETPLMRRGFMPGWRDGIQTAQRMTMRNTGFDVWKL